MAPKITQLRTQAAQTKADYYMANTIWNICRSKLTISKSALNSVALLGNSKYFGIIQSFNELISVEIVTLLRTRWLAFPHRSVTQRAYLWLVFPRWCTRQCWCTLATNVNPTNNASLITGKASLKHMQNQFSTTSSESHWVLAINHRKHALASFLPGQGQTCPEAPVTCRQKVRGRFSWSTSYFPGTGPTSSPALLSGAS